MKNPNLIPQRDPHRRVTKIYLIDETFLTVEVIEWGSGSTPTIVRTQNGQILRQGIEASWSCYPNQAIADEFRRSRQAAFRQLPLSSNVNSTDERKAP